MPILANLLELYAHDFSEFHPVELGEDGRYCYPALPLYWSEAGRFPFLLRIDSKLAGFVLVKRGSEFSDDLAVLDVVEFFVLRAYRKRGVGTLAAHEVWKRMPGPWQVRVMESNVAALSFWTKAISRFAGDSVRACHVHKDGARWSVFSFNSKML